MKHATLIIRPEYGTDPLELKLRDKGVSVFRHGVVAIQHEPVDNELVAQWRSTNWDGIIVVSPIAAHEFHKLLKTKGWPASNAYYTVGPGTADAILELNSQPVIWPAKGHNSESLLELSELQNVEGQKWLIVTGKNGRTILPDTLTKRGAQVTTAEIYSRQPQPAPSAEQIKAWKASDVRIISLTSAEQTTLFLEQLWPEESTWLKQCDWVVPGERIAKVLQKQGIAAKRVHYCGSATPQAVANTILSIKPAESSVMSKTPKAPKSGTKRKSTTDKSSGENAKAPAKSAVREPQIVPRARTGFLYFLFLLLAAGSASAGWWLWQQQQALAAETESRMERLASEQEGASQVTQPEFDRQQFAAEMTERLQQHVNDQLAQERSDYRQQLDRVSRNASAARDDIETLVDEQNRRIAQLSDQVRQSESRNSDHWHALEAFDLVTAAGHRLWFDYDKAGATELLNRAQSLLEDAGRSAYAPVIRQLSNDMALIEDLPSVDTDSIARRLQRLQQQVRELPFARGSAVAPEIEEEISENISEWRRNLAKAWDNFSGDVIRIQRTDEAAVNLNADQRAAVLLSMELQLQIAQQAVYRHQQEYYVSAMGQILTTLDDVFDPQSTEVMQFSAEAEELAAQSVEPVYPTRLLSHAMLRDLVDDIREGRSLNRE